jgi:ABC-type transport system substrate-binding protein
LKKLFLKKKQKYLVSIIRTESKNAVIVVLIVAIVISGIGNLVMSMLTVTLPDHCCNCIIVAKTANPGTMDPCDSWDESSNDMLNQVVETLITYDLSDPGLPLVGRLAESWYWVDNITIVFKLRENIFFHDGTEFTADCVLHTIKRINFFGNATGKLDPAIHTMAIPHSLYKFRDGIPIFNHTLSFKTDDYNVALVLNRPYGPVEGLLTYTASSIVHPDSTPLNEMLKLGSDLVIGTGPFKLVSYISNLEIRFDRWERYWRSGSYFDGIIYRYYEDAISANEAMLALDIDFLGQGISSLKPDFEADTYITVTGDGFNDYINGSNYNFFTFRSEWINLTWRKAICHAFNYTYLIHNIMEDTVSKAHSLVSPGFPAYNSSVVGGSYNIPYARQLLQSMDYGYTEGVPWDVGSQVGETFIPGINETLWTAAEFIPNTGTFTDNQWKFYPYYSILNPSHFNELLTQRFVEDMELIGIKVLPLVWSYGTPPPLGFYNNKHIIWGSINPGYFDSFNQIGSAINLFSPPLNTWIINNSEINAILDKVTIEPDSLQRNEYYKKIQYLIHDKYYYHMPLMYDKIYHVHASTLQGIPYNCMRSQYWYPTYRA